MSRVIYKDVDDVSLTNKLHPSGGSHERMLPEGTEMKPLGGYTASWRLLCFSPGSAHTLRKAEVESRGSRVLNDFLVFELGIRGRKEVISVRSKKKNKKVMGFVKLIRIKRRE